MLFQPIFCPSICFLSIKKLRGGRNQDAIVFATLFCSFLSWDPYFLSADTHWTYMNAHKSKLLFKSIVCLPICFCPLIGCVLIPPPLGFLTTFFVQNLKFSKSFHMNPELEVIKLFWICKMTNTRRSYNCTFALLNRESVWTGRVLIPPPLGLFRVKRGNP